MLIKKRQPQLDRAPILPSSVSKYFFQGMLLEEALLYLLQNTGYKIIENSDNDPTITGTLGSLKVHGRAGDHQIDAIADFRLPHPFSYPQRLLVEAKCYRNRKVDRDTVFKAIAVLKDIQENIRIPDKSGIRIPRYHYQFAIFSASGFDKKVQQYAIAHDIYLIPLYNSIFIRPIINSIYAIVDVFNGVLETKDNKIPIGDVSRKEIRDALRNENENNFHSILETYRINRDFKEIQYLFLNVHEKLKLYVESCRKIKGAYLAILGGRFPVFLVPNPYLSRDVFSPSNKIRIYWSNTYNWYLIDDDTDEELFSFELPTDILKQYNEEGLLEPGTALNIKSDYMSNFYAFYVNDRKEVHVKWFRMNQDWLDKLLASLDEINESHQQPTMK